MGQSSGRGGAEEKRNREGVKGCVMYHRNGNTLNISNFVYRVQAQGGARHGSEFSRRSSRKGR